MNISFLIGNLITFIIIKYINCLTDVFVTIKNGKLKGRTMLTRKGREIASFKSIPYALPPIGSLRFAPPQPATPWNDVKSAINEVPNCMQGLNEVYNINSESGMSEDCLYLNVYTPKLIKKNKLNLNDSNYPVMVWIHGGGFYSGVSHSKLYGPQFLLDNDIVLVTINYRVGAFGFLSTVDNNAYGNNALKDMVLSLQWVQQNIKNFGGDNNKVTIFGESAGAAAVHHLMISPLAKGLFHRIISQSGSNLNPWALHSKKSARKQAFLLGKELDCTSNKTNELIQCLRTKDADKIVDVSKKWRENTNDVFPHFRPVVEPNHQNAVLIENPIDSLKKEYFSNVSLLTGFNEHEGCLMVAPLFGNKDEKIIAKIDQFDVLFDPGAFTYNDICPSNDFERIINDVRNYYLRNGSIDESTRFNLIDWGSELFFTYSQDVCIKEMYKINKNKIYYYYFNYTSNWSWSQQLGDSKRNYGTCHGDELQYLFTIRQAKGNFSYSENDYKMIDKMTTMWCNFAKTGHPTIDESWKPVQSDAFEQFIIENPDNIKMDKQKMKNLKFLENLPCPIAFARN